MPGTEVCEDFQSENTKIPFNNTLVVHGILSYLPIKDLKVARLVSTIWGDEGAKVLKKKTLLTVYLDKLERFLIPDEMTGFLHPNWTITVPSERDNFEGYRELSTDLNPTHLDLHFTPKVIQDFETFSKVMARTGPSLKSLRLEIKPRLDGCTPDTPEASKFLSSLKLCSPTLKNLEIIDSINAEKGTHSSPEVQRRYGLWYQACQDFVETLTVNVEFFTMHSSSSRLIEKCVRGLYVQGQEGKLKTLYVRDYIYFFGWSLNVGTAILNLPQHNLAKLALDLTVLGDSLNRNEAPIVSNILLKYSSSLEKLELILPNPRDVPNAIAVPPMPKLKVLGLHCTHLMGTIFAYKNTSGLSFGDDDDELLIYEKHFPSLQSLSVSAKSYKHKAKPEDVWLRYSKFFGPLFHLDQTCRTLVHLDVPYFWMEGGQVCLTKGVDLGKLKAMFPSVPWHHMDSAVGGCETEIFRVAERLKQLVVSGNKGKLGALSSAALCTRVLGRIKDALDELESELGNN